MHPNTNEGPQSRFSRSTLRARRFTLLFGPFTALWCLRLSSAGLVQNQVAQAQLLDLGGLLGQRFAGALKLLAQPPIVLTQRFIFLFQMRDGIRGRSVRGLTGSLACFRFVLGGKDRGGPGAPLPANRGPRLPQTKSHCAHAQKRDKCSSQVGQKTLEGKNFTTPAACHRFSNFQQRSGMGERPHRLIHWNLWDFL